MSQVQPPHKKHAGNGEGVEDMVGVEVLADVDVTQDYEEATVKVQNLAFFNKASSKSAVNNNNELLEGVKKYDSIVEMSGGFRGLFQEKNAEKPEYFVFSKYAKGKKRLTCVNIFHAAMKLIVQRAELKGVFKGTLLERKGELMSDGKYIMHLCAVLYNLMNIKRSDAHFMSLWRDDPLRKCNAGEVPGWRTLLTEYSADLELVLSQFKKA